ncbi:PI-PLC X domain-containing protein At5g67130 [Cryptomeria japonica]|uniref:PI-PLC X domain-containing protein At5g67130 n=1 Tax=Cryptomeria japonica TaxID=3369 RepID=UPI0025AC041E|nr:PI-PLC X domain-containing protein At5g67130 [Cryptomeria japonica]
MFRVMVSRFLAGFALFIAAYACSNGNCQLLSSCSNARDCGSGLYCGSCPAVGEYNPVCIRGQANRVTSVVNGLPYNKYSWLTTHNAFSILGEPSYTGTPRVTFYNQEDTVTNQLNNGVRGFMLDMYDFLEDVWLCHSFEGQCYNFTAFEPAVNTLREIETFLTSNPTEIVTIFIEDYVHAPKGLTKVFSEAGLSKYWFPVSKMPKSGEDWPTVTYMVANNLRLVVFTSMSSKEASEGIAYQWRYVVENEPGDSGVRSGSCSNREESTPLNSNAASLFLENYFTTIPDQSGTCKDHSSALMSMLNACYQAAGKVPNFLAVNFYMRSDGGGVFDALDRLNGRSLCGCNTVAACQPGAANGVCKNVSVPSISSPATHGSSSSTQPLQTSQASLPQLLSLWVLYIYIAISSYAAVTFSFF